MGQKNAERNNGQMFIMDDENLHIQEAQGNPSMRNIKKTTPKCIFIKLLKASDKDKILKIARKEKHVIYRGTKISMTADSCH